MYSTFELNKPRNMVSANTGIEWTDKTWNPTTGCTKVSPGCTHCYAEAITKRFTQNFPQGFALQLHPERLEMPIHWRKPSRIFVNSMSDLFHEDIPFSFLEKVFEVIGKTPWHVYQILTKRHERLERLAEQLNWYENIWLGVISNCRLGFAIAQPNTTWCCWVSLPQPNLRKINSTKERINQCIYNLQFRYPIPY